MKRPQHPFKTWLVKEHAHADSRVGDLAREVRIDVAFPGEGERRDLRRYLTDEWHDGADWRVAFEAAWQLYEPEGSPADHPFVTWLLRRDLDDGTPLSLFTVQYADELPATGDHDTLRAALVELLDDEDTWNLTCFDVAWEEFNPHCAAPGCGQRSLRDSARCREHTLAELL